MSDAGVKPDPALALAVRSYQENKGPGDPGKGPQDECGVFAIFDSPDAARLTFHGLVALQHRGQESAGIATTDGVRLYAHKGMGLVNDVFDDEGVIAKLPGHAAIGHNRYSTTGSSVLANAQPLVFNSRRGSVALAHNGNLVNALAVRTRLEDEGAIFQTTVDTEVLAHLIMRKRLSLAQALVASLQEVGGGYALVLLAEKELLAVRDPHGIRPLCLGRLGESWVLASESCAFDVVGAEFVREVRPGELICIDESGMRSEQALPPAPPHLCVFEYIYFARPDSNFQGLNVHSVRKDLGRQLAREAPCDVDIVVGVPDSSISAASGYAEQLGIPYEMGLIKNRYIGRTFIQPVQSQRDRGVRFKLNPVRGVVEGRRVCLIDDSIVRGTTSRQIVQMLRDAGATAVHMRISSPPYRNPCYYGIDTSRRGELVATGRDVQQIAEHIGADSLHFLSIEGLLACVHAGAPTHCTACFSSQYPVPVDETADKFILEGDLHD